MSFTYGTLRHTNKVNWPLAGEINSPVIAGKIALKPLPLESNQNAPTHEIHMQTPNGLMMTGNAWEKKTKKGEEFYSMSLDGPHMEKPLYVSAFKSKFGDYDIIWSRPRGEKVADKVEVGQAEWDTPAAHSENMQDNAKGEAAK